MTSTPPALPEKDRSTSTPRAGDFLQGGGEMGALIRELDWSRHPLGKPDNWPQSLKTAVSLILNSQHPMWIGWGTEMSFLYNDAYLHVLGRAKHPWALGRPASEVWSEIWNVCGPLADKVFREGEASFLDDVRFFMNRGEFLEETYYSFSYSPIRDEGGQVGGLFCPSNDVTAKVIGARRLRTLSELSSSALVERTTGAAAAIAAKTLAKNHDDIPFAFLYLIEDGKAVLKETVNLRNVDTLLAPPVVDLAGDSTAIWPLAQVFHSGKSCQIALENFDALPRGTADQPVSRAIVLPVMSRANRQIIGLLVAGLTPARQMNADYETFFELVATHVGTAIQNARAAEEEKKRADALAEIDRAKTAFFSNVSHEFRTPLTLMLGPLENLLEKNRPLPPEEREQIETAHRNGLRLLKLVNSLLDFSRIEAGRIKASFLAADLAALTADLASNFRSAMEAAGLKLEVDCKPLPRPVYVDREMWEKIVLNLLSNAFKFTLEGSVLVRIEAVGDSAVLTVADTGTGIPESELPRLFERFHRVEGAGGRSYEGTGIGLALVQELVKLHGGSVTVKSRVGEGSAFTVAVPFGNAHLPADRTGREIVAQTTTGVRAEAFTAEALTWILEEQIDGTSNGLPPQSTSAKQATARILVADDNRDMREHIAHILGAAFDFVLVADGRAALEEARRIRPDLILSDVMMPRLDGFGLLRELRADTRTVDIPVIMLSARAAEEARTEGMGAGADDYLVKPFSARELLARISAHLNLARMRQEARDQSTRLLESITNGFFALDREWRFTYLNAEAERLKGVRREQLLGRNHWEIFPEAIGTTVHKELTRVMNDRVPADFENYFAPANRWFHIKAYPDAEGGITVFFEDATERKRADRASRLLSAIVDSSDDAIISKDLDGIITSWNKAAQRLFGYTADEAIGQPVASLLIPPDRQQEEPEILARLRNGERVDHFETVRRCKDGTLLDISLTISPVRDADGVIIGASKIARDISYRKHAERVAAALRQSEQDFRELTEVGPQIIWVSGPQGELEFVNRRWIEFSGLDREATKDFNQIGPRLHPDDNLLDHWRKSIETGTPFELEARLRGKDGQFRWFMMRSVPIKDERGRIIKWFGTSTDIHQNKLLELELRRTNRDLEQFAYSVSHDLREPLRSVKLFSELLARRYRDRFDEQALEFLDYLCTGASRMEMLVSDLLAYTRTIQSGTMPEPSDAAAALREALSNLARAIAESDASIEFDALPSVPIHTTQLQQLFQNLVGNAIKYHKPGVSPVVRVCAQRQNSHWRFSVSDNGIGIEPEYQERIFGLFKRLHTGDEYSGSGIGLALCQRIVERHHGRIWVESQPGQGSTFYFTLPA